MAVCMLYNSTRPHSHHHVNNLVSVGVKVHSVEGLGQKLKVLKFPGKDEALIEELG